MAKSSKKPEANKKPAAKAAHAKPHATKAEPAKSATHAPSKHAPTKHAPSKHAHPSKPMMSPLIDTSLAASSAASMIAAGLGARNSKSAGQSTKPESSLFKQMKSGLNKPHSAQMDSLLDKTHGPGAQKTQGFEKQVAHNQTVGSDATRKSVPRRTAG